jgi:SAM-dependent methyltransferase
VRYLHGNLMGTPTHAAYSLINQPVKDKLVEMFGFFLGEVKLNIGCAGNLEAGFINLDMDPRTGCDIVCELGVQQIPLEDSSVDTVLASHFMEHLPRHLLFPVMLELHRVLKPGGHFIAITPYGSSDDAWDNPHHRQCFTENTWMYFSRRLYEIPGTAGYHAFEGQQYADWTISAEHLIPYPEFVNDPKLSWKKKHLRNVIQELHTVMTAHKGEGK